MVKLNTIFQLKNWSSIVPVVKDTFLRFPMPFTLALLAALSALLVMHNIGPFTAHYFASMWYSAVALTSLKLFTESRQWSNTKYLIAAILIVLSIIYYVWTYADIFKSSNDLLFTLAILLSLLFAPYIKTNSSSASVWYFNYQTGVAIFFAGLAAVILGVGISLSLASMDYLFEFKIPSKIYSDVWLICWVILFPVYVLANLAKEFDYEDEACGFPKGVRFITNYILVPLMWVYMAILYAYFFKIIVQWELPRGNLSWMITAFGIIGITTKLLAYPIRHSGTHLLVLFDSYYYYALIVPILLLFIAIGVRINDYGITEQRYTVVLLGLWFATITLIAVVKKNQFHIKTVPMILVAFALFASFGPFSAIELSFKSQKSHFETLLMKHRLLTNGQVVKAKQTVPFKDRQSLSSIADYLMQNEYRFERIKPMFATLLKEPDTKLPANRRYAGGKHLLELMGLKYINRWENKETASTTFNYRRSHIMNSMMLDISGFDYIASGNLYCNRNQGVQALYFNHNNKDSKVYISDKDGLFIVDGDHYGKVTFNLIELAKRLEEQKIKHINARTVNEFILTQSSESGKLRARLSIEQLDGNMSVNDKVVINRVEYKLMVKMID